MWLWKAGPKGEEQDGVARLCQDQSRLRLHSSGAGPDPRGWEKPSDALARRGQAAGAEDGALCPAGREAACVALGRPRAAAASLAGPALASGCHGQARSDPRAAARRRGWRRQARAGTSEARARAGFLRAPTYRPDVARRSRCDVAHGGQRIAPRFKREAIQFTDHSDETRLLLYAPIVGPKRHRFQRSPGTWF